MDDDDYPAPDTVSPEIEGNDILAVIFISIGLMIWWLSFDEYLSLLVHGAAQMNSTALIPTPAGGIEENLNLIITGLMVLYSLFIVLGIMLPVRIRWRDTLLPF